jgi:hypothetical protein
VFAQSARTLAFGLRPIRREGQDGLTYGRFASKLAAG